MKITKERLREIVKEVIKEENEYQKFFKAALEKTGKSIPQMSDDEKKAFFDKIDAAWSAKGEKNEGNAFGAAVSKAKEQGKDNFEVGGKTYKVESVNEGPSSEEIRMAQKVVKQFAKYRRVSDSDAYYDLLNALKAIERQYESINEAKFYAFFNGKKHEIEGKDLWDAKQKAITMLKVPKSKVGLLAIVNAKDHDKGSFVFDNIKKSVKELDLPKVAIPSSVKTKLDIAIDKINDTKLNYQQKLGVLGKIVDGLGLDKSELNKLTSKIRTAL